MTVKALMPVHNLNLVAPLAHKVTDMHVTDTAANVQARSGAVASLIGQGLRQCDVESAIVTLRTLGTSTPMATRTSTTRAPLAALWPSADTSLFERLVQAYIDCRRSKRNSSSCLAFENHLERNLCDLHDELISGTYRPGRSICFVITRPKPREVWAAEFRDRIVHHLLYNHIAPSFIAGFVAGSSACIPGRGTLYAAQRLEHGIRSITENWSRPAFYLKMDLANFFVAIDKHILFTQLAAKVHEPFWLGLARTILFHDPRQNFEYRGDPVLLDQVPPHKRLTNSPADTGLPIGNLSSQFFANVHLNLLDQFCVHQIKARNYVRYVDDFILLDTSPQRLNAAHDRIAAFLPERLGAHLNPTKTILQPVERGVDFVGHVIKPWRRTTRRRTMTTAMSRLRTMPADEVFEAGNSYLGLLCQASHSHADRAQLANVLRGRGHAVKSDFSKIYRRPV